MSTEAMPQPLESEVSRVWWSALLWLAAIGLSCVFLISGVAKLKTPYAFLIGLYDWQLIGPPYARWLAAGLPWLELFIGVGLLGPQTRRPAAALALGLMILFLGAQLFVIARGLEIDCNCFGKGGGKVGWMTVARTLAFTGVLVVLMLSNRGRRAL